MSEKKEKKLLNKKREKDDDDSSSSSEDDGKPVKSLFGNNASGFKGGLFGDLSKPLTQPQSLFGSGSLFGNTSKPSLFGNNDSVLFSKDSALFNFKEKKEESDEEEEGENDNLGKSDSPNPYNPEEEKDKEKEGFRKIYVKKIDNFYMHEKKENEANGKYISKGEGFVSIETHEEKDKRFACVVFRNNIGNLICEGVLNDKFNKFNSYEKKFKHVAHFFFLITKEGKAMSSNAKIPFAKEEDCKAFGDKYTEAISFLKKEEKKELTSSEKKIKCTKIYLSN